MNRKLKPSELSCTISQTRVLHIGIFYILFICILHINTIYFYIYIYIFKTWEHLQTEHPPNEHIPTMHGQLKTPWCFFLHPLNPLQNHLQKGLAHKGLRVTHFNTLELL